MTAGGLLLRCSCPLRWRQSLTIAPRHLTHATASNPAAPTQLKASPLSASSSSPLPMKAPLTTLVTRAGSTLVRGRKVGGESDGPDWKEYSLTGSGSRNSCVVVTEDGFELNTDTPKSMGGTNKSAQPVYHLLAALVGCETATANFVARQMRMRIHGIAFDLKAWRDQRGAIHLPLEAIDDFPVPSHLQVVEGQAAVDTDASQEQIDELAHQVHRRCPIASMLLASGCRLDIRWVKATSN